VKVLVLACFDDAGQFLFPVLIFKGIDKRQEIGDGLPPVLDCALTEKRRIWATTYLASRSQSIF